MSFIVYDTSKVNNLKWKY